MLTPSPTALWGAWPLLTQVTASPTFTVTEAGEKLKSRMDTEAADALALGVWAGWALGAAAAVGPAGAGGAAGAGAGAGAGAAGAGAGCAGAGLGAGAGAGAGAAGTGSSACSVVGQTSTTPRA